MNPKTRVCPFHKCRKLIDPEKFACLNHWRLLSKQEKEDIWEAYNAYQSEIIDPNRLREIQQQVLDSVQKRSYVAEYSACKSCKAAIMWVRSAKTGALMPLDAEPNEKGNVFLIDGRAHVKSGTFFEEAVKGPLYMSHFSTCPDSNSYRKKKR